MSSKWKRLCNRLRNRNKRSETVTNSDQLLTDPSRYPNVADNELPGSAPDITRTSSVVRFWLQPENQLGISSELHCACSCHLQVPKSVTDIACELGQPSSMASDGPVHEGVQKDSDMCATATQSRTSILKGSATNLHMIPSGSSNSPALCRQLSNTQALGRRISSSQGLCRRLSEKFSTSRLGPSRSNSINRVCPDGLEAVKVDSDTELGQHEPKQSLSALPVELILHICQYIPRDGSFTALRSTSKRLCSILTSVYAVRTSRLEIHQDIKPKLILNVLGVSSNLTVLNVSNCLSITDQFLVYITKNCREITDINVSGCVLVTDKGIEKMTRYLKRITVLAVANLRQVTCDSILSLLKQHQESVMELDLSCCYGLEENAFRLSYMGDFCPNLRCLKFRWSSEYIKWIPMWEVRIGQLCGQCKQLKYLDLSCSPSRDIKEVVDVISSHCVYLQHLNLSLCCVRDDSLLKIAISFPLLEYLNLSGCSELSDVSLAFAMRHLPRLSHLDISSCAKVTDECLLLMLVGLPALRHLFLQDCYQLTDSSLTQIPLINTKLCFLDVSGTMLTADGPRAILTLASAGMILVTERCPLIIGAQYDKIWKRLPLVFLPHQQSFRAAKLRNNS